MDPKPVGAGEEVREGNPDPRGFRSDEFELVKDGDVVAGCDGTGVSDGDHVLPSQSASSWNRSQRQHTCEDL